MKKHNAKAIIAANIERLRAEHEVLVKMGFEPDELKTVFFPDGPQVQPRRKPEREPS